MKLHRPQRRVILLFVPILLCALAAFALPALRPRTITGHAAAISVVLQQRGIAHQRVTLSEHWPDAVNYYAYGPSVRPYSAAVTIIIADGTTIPGSLECADDQRRCRVTIARLGVDREPIPDISERRRLPWVEWLDKVSRWKVEG